MASQNFIFPPPPPPPPVSGAQNFAPTGADRFSNQHRSGRGQSRGRGRGGNFRGQQGGHRGGFGFGGPQSHQSRSGNAQNGFNTPNVSQTAYDPPGYLASPQQQFRPLWPSSYDPKPPIPQASQSHQQYPSYGPNISNPNGYAQGYGNQSYYVQKSVSSNPNGPFPSLFQGRQQTKPLSNMMGPQPDGGFSGNQNSNVRNNSSYALHQDSVNRSHAGSGSSFRAPNSRGQGLKRGHNEAFGFRRKDSSAPAPVPSFGAPLPTNPSQIAAAGTSSKKKKRKHNQLGLTPRTEDPESSENEDEDEEAKLAASLGMSGQQGLVFSYGGRTSRLSSSAEIVAWIAERKKRFPTKARIAEAKARRAKAQEETRLARERRQEEEKKKREEFQDAKRRKQTKRIQEALAAQAQSLERKTAAAEGPPKSKKQKHGSEMGDEAAKAKLKAEKLRKKLAKAQKLVEDLEAEDNAPKASSHERFTRADEGKSMNVPSQFHKDEMLGQHVNASNHDGSSSIELTDDVENRQSPRDSKPAQKATRSPLTPKSRSSSPALKPSLQLLKSPPAPLEDPSSPISSSNLSSSDLSDSDQTSSSGSSLSLSPSPSESDLSDSPSSSDLSSDSSDSDLSDSTSFSSSSSPEERPSRGAGPMRVAPPPRAQKPSSSQRLCPHFARFRRCRYGPRCRFRHKLPAAKGRKKSGGGQCGETAEGKPVMGIYQRLLQRQREEEDEMLLRHIMFLGEQGALDRPGDAPKPS